MSIQEQVKSEANTLTDYLATVGKRLKHTHALEAIARIRGYPSWAELRTANPDPVA